MDLRVLLIGIFVVPQVIGKLSCKNEKGQDVEWFIAYKLPKSTNKNSSMTTDGKELAYIDAKTKSSATPWKMLDAKITESGNNPIALTMAGLYKKKAKKSSLDHLYVVYNDQPPQPYNGTSRGHTKGVLEFDNKGGYWMQHSVPRFPFDVNTNKGYQYPNSGHNNGQTFMCISFNFKELQKIVAALRQQYPYVYEGDASTEIRKVDGVNELLSKGFFKRPKVQVLEDTLSGLMGTKFLSFAKHHKAQTDVYSTAVSPKLNVDLLVEVWRNGAGGRLEAYCPLKNNTVANLVNMNIKFNDKKNVQFKTTEDHSKWAISDDKNNPWFCIGSLNRMLSQYKRGGQVTCFKNQVAHGAFASGIEACEMCTNPNKGGSSYCKRQASKDE